MLYFNDLLNKLSSLSKKTLYKLIFVFFNIFLLILLTIAIIDISNKKPLYFEFDIIIIVLFLIWFSICLFYSIYRHYMKTNYVDTNNDINIFEMVDHNDYNVQTNNHLSRFSSIVASI